MSTAQKVSVFGVILVPIQSEYGKIRTRITPNLDTFNTVQYSRIGLKWVLTHTLNLILNSAFSESPVPGPSQLYRLCRKGTTNRETFVEGKYSILLGTFAGMFLPLLYSPSPNSAMPMEKFNDLEAVVKRCSVKNVFLQISQNSHVKLSRSQFFVI